MQWDCARCATRHARRPSTCRECGHATFERVPDVSVAPEPQGVEAPEPLQIDQRTTGRASRTPPGDSTPDVAPDGSIKRDAQDRARAAQAATSHGDGTNPAIEHLRGAMHWWRGLARAPFSLAWEYRVALLAFVLVFGAIALLLAEFGVLPWVVL